MTGRRLTIALLPIALVVLLASCGGGDDSAKKPDSATVVDQTGPTGTDGSANPDDSAGTGGSGAADSGTGGAGPTTPPAGRGGDAGTRQGSTPENTRKKKSGGSGDASPPKAPTIEELKKQVDKLNEQLKKDKPKNQTPDAGSSPPPPAKPSAGPQEVLYLKAKRVCGTIGVNGLAQRYGVAQSPEAVATAYANSYPDTFRKAVHDGCKAAF